ncbi:MAG: hypothetical protein RPU34_14720 [Candidatus Sedimenticola sp. (ex Thyasira tokunagai)]
MKHHIGSTIALAIGILSILTGLSNSPASVIAGMVIILGALAYRSAKKRKLGTVRSSLSRRAIELVAILTALAVVLLQNDLAFLIQSDPVRNLIIPAWVLVAYVSVLIWMPRGAADE